MKVLFDTHLLVWSASNDPRLGKDAIALLSDPAIEAIYSVVSLWEIAIKFNRQRPDFTLDPRSLRRNLLDNGYAEIDVTAAHILAMIGLPPIHRDPFDRLLVAQSLAEGIVLATGDRRIAEYGNLIRAC